jgi:hypothetical protein
MINQYKCPIDKISTIINFCNILSTMILNQNNLLTKNNKSINENENNFKQRLAGADELLPIVVYTLIKGNVPKLKSNLNYIKLFRHNTMLDSNAEEYFITFIESGISFIEKLDDDLKGLKIDNFEEINKKISEEKNVVNYDFKEIENVKNKDENYIIYYLNEMNEKQKSDNLNYEEEKINNINLNVNSNVDKNVLNEDENFLNKIDFNKLDKEYFKNKELKEIPIFNLEKMVNDFKIILLLLKKYNNNNNK